jgi:hypothetical protein
MTKRVDIIGVEDLYDKKGSVVKYGLIYTEKCGWVDLGHANPIGGASKLWDDICSKTVSYQCLKEPTKEVYISYSQSMRKMGMSASVAHVYALHKELTVEEQRSIGLTIFMNVSVAFEAMQSEWPYAWATASGFSAEDLVSDLIGYYRAVFPKLDFIAAFGKISSKIEAYEIWDNYGEVGNVKNKTFNPLIFPGFAEEKKTTTPASAANSASAQKKIEEKPKKILVPSFVGKLPDVFNSIKPAREGNKFRKLS